MISLSIYLEGLGIDSRWDKLYHTVQKGERRRKVHETIPVTVICLGQNTSAEVTNYQHRKLQFLLNYAEDSRKVRQAVAILILIKKIFNTNVNK
jgi:hypothetical protein